MNIEALFKQVFASEITAIYQAPARINLIGEHIDYNGGKVLPCAISCYITGYISRRDDNKIVAYSTSYSEPISIDLSSIKYTEANSWANYVFGVFDTLKKERLVVPHGLNIMVDSNIPLGSGLSSSAALLDLILYIANDQFDLHLDLKTIARLAQKTENEFCGLKCGIMDQAAIALGQKNKAILLDCALFEYEYKDIDLGDYSFVILKTNTPRSLVESKYNVRVKECSDALTKIQEIYEVDSLSELKVDQLDKIEPIINDEIEFRRVRHVVTENDRVNAFVKALDANDIKTLGRLLNESHQSLKEDYEVTGQYLDTIVEAALRAGAIGARMTGAGFGGCAIALIKLSDFASFKKQVEEYFFEKLHIHPDVFQVDIVDGPKRIR